MGSWGSSDPDTTQLFPLQDHSVCLLLLSFISKDLRSAMCFKGPIQLASSRDTAQLRGISELTGIVIGKSFRFNNGLYISFS